MTYTGVFLLVSGGSPAGHVAAACWPPASGGYFQRVDRPKPMMMKPKPIAMFHSPMLPIG
jgi:hypothetical protein